MMQRVIVPLDGSELSESAIGLGQILARSFGAALELTTVLTEPVMLDLLPSLLLPDRSAAEHYLEKVASRVSPDIETFSYVIRGNPVEELLRLTSGQPDVVVVMSTHGRGGLGRVMYGSVADKVLRGSTVPVALVRGGVAAEKSTLNSLLVPLDGSELAGQALALAAELGARVDATLTLVRVVEPIWSTTYGAFAEASMLASQQIIEVEQQLQAEARADLDRIATGLRERGLRVGWEVRAGRPADEIVRAAETTSADLIVISTHGRGGLRRFALGSVTSEIMHRGVTPILAIPPGSSAEVSYDGVAPSASELSVHHREGALKSG
ncbi:MAG TPA: universal stress protein [Thermomicrobiales bacterium]|nr:universal stress protein [Thermomicrobiales bacterium]